MRTVDFIALILSTYTIGSIRSVKDSGDNGFGYFNDKLLQYTDDRYILIRRRFEDSEREFNSTLPPGIREDKELFKEFTEIVKNQRGEASTGVSFNLIRTWTDFRDSEIKRINGEIFRLNKCKNSDKVKALRMKKNEEIQWNKDYRTSIDCAGLYRVLNEMNNMKKEHGILSSEHTANFIEAMSNLVLFIIKSQKVLEFSSSDREVLEGLVREIEVINPDENVHNATRNLFYDYVISACYHVKWKWFDLNSVGMLHSRISDLNVTSDEPSAVPTAPVDDTLPTVPRPESPDEDTRQCAFCGARGRVDKLKKCKCRQVRYCGRDCQMSDWPRHKQDCACQRVDLRHQDEGGEGPAARGPVLRGDQAPAMHSEDEDA